MIVAALMAMLGTWGASRPARLDTVPSLAGATAWLNTPALTPAGLRGKVVLLDVWTYTCINWLRTLPYVRAWAEKYRDHGLVVIGVHAPEFGFERNLDNVRRMVGVLRIPYPVALDNDYAIWRALDNQYWPALYFVDAKGRIRNLLIGEGNYAEAERFIQRLLEESGKRGFTKELVTPKGQGIEAEADQSRLQSLETYTGYDRAERFASPGGQVRNKAQSYAIPDRLELNQWAVSGTWSMGRQALALKEAGGKVVYRFHARDLHLVMSPPSGKAPVRIRVRVDGRAPGPAHGADIDAEGNGTVTEPRLYQLIRQSGIIGEHQIEIEFLDPGIELYAFTFG